MATNQDAATNSPLNWLRKRRRRYVKRFGKRAIRSLFGYLGRQSLVGDAPVLDKSLFPELRPLEENWQVIRAELDKVLEARDALPPFQMVSRDQKRIAQGDRWKTFILYGFRYRAPKNCAQCPETAKLLDAIPGLETAFFSILSPGYHIPAHRGITKGLVRGHLGLKVPQDRANCTMRVDQTSNMWAEGELLIFDDTYDHEVWNNTDEERVVLLFDIVRPMRFGGRILNKAFLKGIRWTSYYKDARKQVDTWEDRFEAAVMRADALHIEAENKGARRD